MNILHPASTDTEPLAESCSLDALHSEVEKAFEKVHGGRPTHFISAPGRVNVIGEHVDYNGGFVLPAAIERWICAAVRPRSDSKIIITDARLGSSMAVLADKLARSPDRSWSNYVKGVLAGFARRGHVISGFEATFYSTIPMGGGLSSSAALEATIALAVCALNNLSISRIELARLCQQAEHEYAGVPCGLMDQAAVLLSRAGQLLQLDCQDESVQYCPWSDHSWQLMIINSGVVHELASGEYRQRRQCCHEAARILGLDTLRSIDPGHLDAALLHPRLSDEMRRCVRHVVTENSRTREVVAALSRGDYATMGQLMKASHTSLRDDYRVSCLELDCIARTMNQLEGVAGCRMTGGGFGGSAIALVQTSAAASVQRALESEFRIRFSRQPAIFLTRPAAGACTRAA